MRGITSIVAFASCLCTAGALLLLPSRTVGSFTKRDVKVQSLDNGGDESPELAPAWATIKKYVPPIITGSWDPDDNERNKRPGEAIYNMVFIRIPVIVAGIWFAQFYVTGHHFVMDFGFGSGPVEISPLVTAGIVAFMLL